MINLSSETFVVLISQHNTTRHVHNQRRPPVGGQTICGIRFLSPKLFVDNAGSTHQCRTRRNGTERLNAGLNLDIIYSLQTLLQEEWYYNSGNQEHKRRTSEKLDI